MRTKEEIVDDVNDIRSSVYTGKVKLEMLIDIRDVLSDISKTLKTINYPIHYMPIGAGGMACQHVSDGNVYPSFPPKYKCIKCGQFCPTIINQAGSTSAL